MNPEHSPLCDCEYCTTDREARSEFEAWLDEQEAEAEVKRQTAEWMQTYFDPIIAWLKDGVEIGGEA